MSRETISKAFPTSLSLAGRHMSTITSKKSTRISTTPNMLEERTDSIFRHHQDLDELTQCQSKNWDPKTHSPKSKGHDTRTYLLADIARKTGEGVRWCFHFTRLLHKMLSNSLIHCVWQHNRVLPVINLHFCILHRGNIPRREKTDGWMTQTGQKKNKIWWFDLTGSARLVSPFLTHSHPNRSLGRSGQRT